MSFDGVETNVVLPATLSSTPVFNPRLLSLRYDRWLSYGQSKSANILMALQLEQFLAPRGVHAFSLHREFVPVCGSTPGISGSLNLSYPAFFPAGGILTGLQKHMTHEEQVAMGWFKADGKTPIDGFKTVPEGASTTIYAALHKPLDAVGGAYLEDCRPSTTQPPERHSKEDAKKLWDMTLAWIKEKGFGGWDESQFKL